MRWRRPKPWPLPGCRRLEFGAFFRNSLFEADLRGIDIEDLHAVEGGQLLAGIHAVVLMQLPTQPFGHVGWQADTKCLPSITFESLSVFDDLLDGIHGCVQVWVRKDEIRLNSHGSWAYDRVIGLSASRGSDKAIAPVVWMR